MENVYYSKMQPNLIEPKIKETFDKLGEINEKTGQTISEIITNKMYTFYSDYISKNLFIITIFLIAFIFLTYRYYKNKEEKYSIINEIQAQTKHLQNNSQPHFNPLYPVDEQNDNLLINYPADPLPIDINGKKEWMRNNDFNHSPNPPLSNDKLNDPSTYDYNNVYKNDSRLYYHGSQQPNRKPDTTIRNPYGFLNNFNTSTDDFISQAAKGNSDTISNLRDGLREKEHDMIYGTKYVSPYYT